MYAKFQIFRGQDQQFYFRFKSSSGDTLGGSEAYTQKQGALNGINSVKTNAGDLRNFTIFEDSSKKYRFRLQAKNGEPILRSTDSYPTKELATKAATEVSTQAPGAQVEDLTNT